MRKGRARLLKAMKKLEKRYESTPPEQKVVRARLEKQALSIQERIEKA